MHQNQWEHQNGGGPVGFQASYVVQVSYVAPVAGMVIAGQNNLRQAAYSIPRRRAASFCQLER